MLDGKNVAIDGEATYDFNGYIYEAKIEDIDALVLFSINLPLVSIETDISL